MDDIFLFDWSPGPTIRTGAGPQGGQTDSSCSCEGGFSWSFQSSDTANDSLDVLCGTSSIARGPLHADSCFSHASQPAADSGHPEVVVEQSDDSWNSEDDREEWQSRYEEQLVHFLRDPRRVCLITDPLPSKKRKQVHSMAHYKRLSHMSVGAGKTKMIVIAKPAIHGATTTHSRWSTGRSQAANGIIDPRIVTFRISNWRPGATLLEACAEFFTRKQIAPPLSTDIAAIHLENERYSSGCWNVRAFFTCPAEAALAVKALQIGDQTGGDLHLERCDYTIFESCLWSATERVEHYASVPSIPFPEPGFEACHSESWEIFAGRLQAMDPFQQQDVNIINSAMNHERPLATRANSGYGSGESGDSACAMPSFDHGTLPGGSRRERQRFIEAGYSCSHGCGKTFNTAGERTKHEKIHLPDRDHHCDECGHGFLYRKDLRRHGSRTGHHTGAHSSTEN